MEDDVDGRTVLVVDDDELLLRAYKRHSSTTLRIVTASNADAACRVAAEADPDLAIVDVFLDGASGIDLVRELKSRHPTLRVAVISANATIDLTVVAMRSGADTVISKPTSMSEVLRRLDEDVATLDRMPPTAARAEWEHMVRILSDCAGNKSEAARRLRICRSTVQRRLKRPPPRV